MGNFETGFNNDAHIERIKKLSKVDSVIFGVKKQEGAEDDSGDYNDHAFEPDVWIAKIEGVLRQKIEAIGGEEEKVDFNLKLDNKLEEYRKRVSVSIGDKNSENYKDSLYKLTIGGILRISGEINLEEAYDAIESKVGIDNIDGDIFNNAWKVIKSYTENGFRKESQVDREELKKQTQYIEEIPSIIKKPNDEVLLSKLENKLSEYKTRMDSAKEQFENDSKNIIAEQKYWDSMFKFTVLANLLHNGEVVENDIASALSEVHNGIKYPDRLNNAFKVVKAYVEGGKTTGGTGI
jgi:hypothetical protein